ncbi:MAG TPA: hypothetical protein VNM69_00535 [Bacillus sp. (in: firmicutes)]|uniref:hypothetical protein n=1 Tax=Bacillus litorisediminis TaxID=2922713 RepID=UPI001FB0358B|nr:hypothetical protein [Bacillus litorisediminis]HWO74382.1 hypothetical protein [Bacillus sp. (in: firmicutes)]
MKKGNTIGTFSLLFLLTMGIFFSKNPFNKVLAEPPYSQNEIKKANQLADKIAKIDLDERIRTILNEEGYDYAGSITLVYPDKIELELKINDEINKDKKSDILKVVNKIIQESNFNPEYFDIKISDSSRFYNG